MGLTEDQARAQGIEPLVSKLPLEHVPRSLAARDTRGFVKLVADGASRKIIGAHILAAEAGEMITEPALAIKYGLTIEDLTVTFHPYLTLSEGIKLAAPGKAGQPPEKRGAHRLRVFISFDDIQHGGPHAPRRRTRSLCSDGSGRVADQP